MSHFSSAPSLRLLLVRSFLWQLPVAWFILSLYSTSWLISGFCFFSHSHCTYFLRPWPNEEFFLAIRQGWSPPRGIMHGPCDMWKFNNPPPAPSTPRENQRTQCSLSVLDEMNFSSALESCAEDAGKARLIDTLFNHTLSAFRPPHRPGHPCQYSIAAHRVTF